MQGLVRLFVCAALALGVLLLTDLGPLSAQTVISSEDIEMALNAKRPTQLPAPDPEAQRTIKLVLAQVGNVGSLDPSMKVLILRSTRLDYIPAVDLPVYFDFDSADITDKAKVTLDPLARALARPSLKGVAIVLAGFTDATGKPDYNKELSQRRADAVRDYLVSGQRPMPRKLLIPIGFGEAFLKDKQNPASGINRRVQIINLGR
jgi:outer membrane protein OmpA-like peptidoglycan-associated protein